MKCDLEILLSGYVDNQLSQEQKVCVEKAVGENKNFHNQLQDITTIKKNIGDLQSPMPDNCSWDQFNVSLWQKIDIEKNSSFKFSLKRKVVFVVAIFFIVIFSLFLPHCIEYEDGSYSLDYRPAITWPKSNVEHHPLNIVANVPRYKIANDIDNLKDANLDEKELQFLEREGFVVTQKIYNSFVDIYKDNQLKKIPSFITIDTAVSGFSHILGRLNIEIEREVLYEKLSLFTEAIANQLIRIHPRVPQKYHKESYRALAFIRVACVLLDLKYEWPKEILDEIEPLVRKELELIYQGPENPVEIINSPIFGYPMDYNRFKIPENKDENLQKYDLAHEWYARCLFRVSESHVSEMAHLSETRSALLILIATISSYDAMPIWEEIHYVLTALYGKVDDPHLLDYLQTAREVYGSVINLNALSDDKNLVKFCKAISRVRLPKIRSELGLQSGLRIFARRGIGCDFVLQQLTYPYVGGRNLPRVDPSLLDIAVIMGYHKAKEVARKKGYFEYENYDTQVKKYEDRLKRELVNSPWTKGGLISIAWMYESLQHPEGKGSPIFSHSDAWQARKLTLMACGLIDLASGNPIFTGKANHNLNGTIDPYPEFFNRMVTKIKHLEEVLQRIGYPLNKGVGHELMQYRDAIKRISEIATKMLANEKLTNEDFQCIGDFTLGWEGAYGNATIQDISTMYYRNNWDFDNRLYVGTGSIYELWVAVPINGKIKIARGGIFGFHEFQSMRQLSPAKWQQLFPKPGIASWIKEYKDSTKR